MAYEKTIWVNGQAPALDAEHLNKMEDGIAGAYAAASQALEAAQNAGMKMTVLWENPNSTGNFTQGGSVNLTNVPRDAKFIGMEFAGAQNQAVPFKCSVIVPFKFTQWIYTPMVERSYPMTEGNQSYPAWYTAKIDISNVSYSGTAELSGWFSNRGNIASWNNSIFKIFALS